MHLGGIFVQSNHNLIQIIYLAERRYNMNPPTPYPNRKPYQIEIRNSVCKNEAHDWTIKVPMHVSKLQQALSSPEREKFS